MKTKFALLRNFSIACKEVCLKGLESVLSSAAQIQMYPHVADSREASEFSWRSTAK